MPHSTFLGLERSTFFGLEGLVASTLKSAIVVVIAVLIWALGRFLITQLTRRIIAGYGSLHKVMKARREDKRAGANADRVPAASGAAMPGTATCGSEQMAQLNAQRRAGRAKTVASLLKSVLNVIVVICAGLMILDAFNINVAPLLATAGLAGVLVGFGAQQLVRDYLAGIFITVEDQYGIGDVIETSNIVGLVRDVGLRVTTLVDAQGAIWYIRNGDIAQVGNRTQGHYTGAKFRFEHVQASKAAHGGAQHNDAATGPDGGRPDSHT